MTCVFLKTSFIKRENSGGKVPSDEQIDVLTFSFPASFKKQPTNQPRVLVVLELLVNCDASKQGEEWRFIYYCGAAEKRGGPVRAVASGSV